MNNFPAMTEEQREDLAAECRRLIAEAKNPGAGYRTVAKGKVAEIALAALTADTSKLAELAAKVRKVREDAAGFDGDRRGMWEYQEEQEQLLLEEAVKYTAPPAPILKPIELIKDLPANEGESHEYRVGFAMGCAKYAEGIIKNIRAAGYEVK